MARKEIEDDVVRGGGVPTPRPARTRDPERRERILVAAADLFSKHGYQTVHLDHIGAKVGIVGSAIYRHFDGKAAILLEFFDKVVDRLITDAEGALAEADGPRDTLMRLIDSQVSFTIEDRHLVQVYISEWRSLPETDLRRLRWKHRHYITLWEETLLKVRPEIDRSEAEVLVQAAINGIHSILLYRPTAPREALAPMLRAMSVRTLGLTEAEPVSHN